MPLAAHVPQLLESYSAFYACSLARPNVPTEINGGPSGARSRSPMRIYCRPAPYHTLSGVFAAHPPGLQLKSRFYKPSSADALPGCCSAFFLGTIALRPAARSPRLMRGARAAGSQDSPGLLVIAASSERHVRDASKAPLKCPALLRLFKSAARSLSTQARSAAEGRAEAAVAADNDGKVAEASVGGGWPRQGTAEGRGDPGDWNNSPEWWGPQGGGWGHSAGEVIFRQGSRFANGEVTVTAHDSSPQKSDLARLLSGTPEEEGGAVLGHEWRVLRFNEVTRQSVARVASVWAPGSPQGVIRRQQPNCLAFECDFPLSLLWALPLA
eukprot:jgi/Mesen1/194/ME1137539C07539